MTPDNMPHNINWITLVAAITGLFSWLCPDIPSSVRTDILIVAFVAYLAVIPYVHSFVNHKVLPSIDSTKQAGAHSDLPISQPNPTAKASSAEASLATQKEP